MADDIQSKSRPFVSEWRNALEIGDKQIDTEHRKLFTLVKDLEHGRVEQTVSALKDYAVTHFTNEQAMMRRQNYPNLEAHIEMHETFKRSVNSICEENAPWTEERVLDLKRFLNKWLRGHIGTHDQRFGEWMRTHQPIASNTSVPDEISGLHPSALYVAYKTIWRKINGWFRILVE